MNDKIYFSRVVSGFVIGMILLTLIMRIIPEKDYFDGEYASWWQQKDYTHAQGESAQIIFLGDSAFKVAIIPAMISDSAYNLSLGGAGPIEMYYTLKYYMQSHPKPKEVFISLAPMNFTYLKRYRDRALYFHFFTPRDQIESQFHIFKEDHTPLRDVLPQSLETLQMMIKFPTIYFQTIVKSELARGTINDEEYQKIASEKGHMLFGQEPAWFEHYVPHEQLHVDFIPLESTKYYMKRLLQLCIDNEIPVHIVQTPINRMSYATAQEHDYFPPYQEYLRYLKDKFNIDVETELIFYDVTLFGDHLHLTEKGAEIFTNNLKEKYHL